MAHPIDAREPAPHTVPSMDRAPYDVGLDARHLQARRILLAVMVLYSDGPLSADDVAAITDAVGVLAALLRR